MSLAFPGIFKLPDAGAAPPLNWRKLLPAMVKLRFRFLFRNMQDLRSGVLFKFAKTGGAVAEMPYFIELAQPIMANAWQQNKQHNFRWAAQFVNAVTLQPGQVFSFWKTIGNPTEAKGFKKGRNIVNGRVSETSGGGLCQLSGIIYHASLMAGLEILERHNHSVDLYANGETRFTPLGADATVAFGYKDLRVENPFGFPVRFEVEIVEEALVCRLRSEQEITTMEIEFQVVQKKGWTEVLTSKRVSSGHTQALCHSVYRVDRL